MSSSEEELGAAPRQLAQTVVDQCEEQIDASSDAFTVACAVKFETIPYFETCNEEWDYKFDLAPHLRAMILRELEDYKWTELSDFLKTENRARTIGYDPDKFKRGKKAPHRTTITRSINDRLDDDLEEALRLAIYQVQEYALETGNPIGSQQIGVEEEKEDDYSRRSKYRLKREKTTRLAKQFLGLFYDELELPVPDGAEVDKNDLFDLFLHMALTDDFANGGSETRRYEVDDETTVPSGETFRDYIRELDELEESEVSEIFNQVNELLWSIAEKHDYVGRNMVRDVAVDGHAWLFYGDEDTPRITGVDPDQGTDMAYEFLTLSIIGDGGEKFTVGVIPVVSRQEKIEAVKDLLEEAQDRLIVKTAMFDRGFYGTLFAQAMKETSVNCVVRAQAGYKSKKMWENAEDGVNVERVTMSRSNAPYESVEVTRFVVPARDDADAEYMAFFATFELTERQAEELGERYKRRWAIETSYRVIGNFLPKTASKDYALRVWYFRMAVLLYNVWVMLNTIVAASLNRSLDASPPVTSKYFLTVLRKLHSDQAVS